eukprot:5827395-Pleurochrysis_carterae.AAC.1
MNRSPSTDARFACSTEAYGPITATPSRRSDTTNAVSKLASNMTWLPPRRLVPAALTSKQMRKVCPTFP